jgi:hypothetical protein
MRIVQPSCDCPAHRHHAPKSKLGGWSVILPLLACAICPACLATYAKLLSILGVSVGMTESQHLLVLATAVLVSIVVSALRSWRSKRWWPLAFALSGASLIVIGHAVHSLHALEWAGVLVLLLGGLREHFKLSAHAAAFPQLRDTQNYEQRRNQYVGDTLEVGRHS